MADKRNPLPLEDILRDLAVLRATGVNLSGLVPQSAMANTARSVVDNFVERSDEFVKETRKAIRVHHQGEVDKQGGSVDELRDKLEDVVGELDKAKHGGL